MREYFDIKWLSLIACNLLMLILIAIHHEPAQSNKQGLVEVQNKLNEIKVKLNQPPPILDLSSINHHIDVLRQFITQLKQQDTHQLGELFSTEQATIKSQLNSMTELLNRLEEQKHPIKMLPTDSLPFKIVSIDAIQDVSVISVKYDYKTQALEQGDSLAGWKVTQLDFAKQFVDFENMEHAHVQVNLQHGSLASE